MSDKLEMKAPIQIDWTETEQMTLNIMARAYKMSVSDYVRGKVFPWSDIGEKRRENIDNLLKISANLEAFLEEE